MRRLLPLAALCASPAPALAATGGGPADGYTWIDSSEPGGPTFQVLQTNTNLALGNDDALAVSLPFTFEVYGQPFTSVYVGSNGYISFGAPIAAANPTCPVTSSATPLIAPIWDDLNPSGGQVSWGVLQTPPNRIFAVSWQNVTAVGGTNPGGFQARLYEADYHFEFHYGDLNFGNGVASNGGGSGFVGVAGATQAATLVCNGVGTGIPNPYAVRFELVPCADGDGDGYPAAACGGTDCDDTNPAVSPGLPEACDGLDTNCDGQLGVTEGDGDGDGWAPCEGDCNDADPAMNPDATDIPNNAIDEDCDGFDATGSGDDDTGDDDAGDDDAGDDDAGDDDAGDDDSAADDDDGDDDDTGSVNAACGCGSGSRRSLLPLSVLAALTLRRRAS